MRRRPRASRPQRPRGSCATSCARRCACGSRATSRWGCFSPAASIRARWWPACARSPASGSAPSPSGLVRARPRTMSCPMRGWWPDGSRPSITRRSSSPSSPTCCRRSSTTSTSPSPTRRRSRPSSSPRRRPGTSRWCCRGSGGRDIRRLPALPRAPPLPALYGAAPAAPDAAGRRRSAPRARVRGQPELGKPDPAVSRRQRSAAARPLSRLDALFLRRRPRAPGHAGASPALERTCRRRPAESLRGTRSRRSGRRRLPHRLERPSARRPARHGRPDEHGPLAGVARPVLRPPRGRAEPSRRTGGQAAETPPEGPAQGRVRRRPAPRDPLSTQAGLHDPAGALAAHGSEIAHGRSPVARPREGAWPLRGCRGGRAQARAPGGPTEPRRPALDAHDGRAVDATVPGRARALERTRVTGGPVLITGGAGFIGSHLVEALAVKGARMRVLDPLEPQVHGRGASAPPYLPKGVEFLRGSVTDPQAVDAALRDVGAVVHLAAQVGVGQSMYTIGRYVTDNAVGTAVLLDRIVNGGHGVRRLGVASSMSIYGEGRYPGAACRVGAPHPRT